AYSAARRLLAGDDVAQGRLCFKHSVLEERTGSYPQALRWLRRGMDPLESRTDEPALQQRARLIASYGLIRQAQGRRLDAVRWLERTIVAAERANELEALAHAYSCSTGRSSSWVVARKRCTRSGRWPCTSSSARSGRQRRSTTT